MSSIENIFSLLISLFKNLPENLSYWGNEYGLGIYLILFLIIFAETGLVIIPFLPGDSLLFATGALIPQIPDLDISLMIALLTLAAVLGDFTNYHIGFYVSKIISNKPLKFINTEHLKKTQNFYNKHGGKTIIIARFMPIIRTYAPFVAGLGKMNYKNFFFYNVIGGLFWVSSFILLGYFFGNLPSVKSNFQYIVFAIIFISILPLIIEFIKSKRT